MVSLNHPPLDLRRRFALGTLGPPFDFAIAAHLDACPACRVSVEGFEIVGGVLANEMPAIPLAEGALDSVLARLDERPSRTADRSPDWLPSSLQGVKIGPEFPVGPGVFMRRIWSGRGGHGRAYLLRAKPGAELPRHDHESVEMTCVLKGGYSDEAGPHPVGDCLIARAGQAHTPHVDDDGECICLIATDAPPKAPGLPGLIMRALM